MPRPGNYESPADDPVGPLFDFRNNVFYNWGGGYAGYNADTNTMSRYNFIGNYYLRGHDSQSNSVAFEENSTGARAFFSGNFLDGHEPDDAWSLVRIKNPEVDAARLHVTKPFATAAVDTEAAPAAYEHVLAHAGSRCKRDGVDLRVLKSLRERSGQLIDSQTQVGGWPSLETGQPYADTDHDGMSDEWEMRHHLNPRNARDGAKLAQDGYSNLEHFLNELAQACDAS
jgi:hypothetical protein